MSSELENRRLGSLDAFRGMTIASMILVSCPGSYRAVYSQLKHAHGTDGRLPIPSFHFFLFVLGVAILFSFAYRKERGISDSQLEIKIVKRTLILFGLGLFMNSYPIFHPVHPPYTRRLTKAALCYLFASMIVLKYGPRGQTCWLMGLLASYWLMVRFIPVPGIGTGVLEPGRNFCAYVDSLFLGGHMFSQFETWDPEGLISTIPAIGTTLFGALTGNWLRSPLSGRQKTAGMMCAGIVLVVTGMGLDRWLPINKNIWTSTFSIFMAGLALLTLVPFYWLIDVKGYRRWATVFVIFGMNPVAIYFLSEILDTSLRFVLLPRGRIHDGFAGLSPQESVRCACKPRKCLPSLRDFLCGSYVPACMGTVEGQVVHKDLAGLIFSEPKRQAHGLRVAGQAMKVFPGSWSSTVLLWVGRRPGIARPAGSRAAASSINARSRPGPRQRPLFPRIPFAAWAFLSSRWHYGERGQR